MTLMKAVEAGSMSSTPALSPLAMGTSQPPTESMVAALAGTEYDTGLDLAKLDVLTRYFTPLREKYLKSGLLDPKVLKVNVNALMYRVPGGMLSNRCPSLNRRARRISSPPCWRRCRASRADVGYPRWLRPRPRIVGTQAVFNVLTGERYKTVTKEFKDIVLGKYGKTPVPIKPEFVKKICGDAQPITYRPADDLKPEMETLRAEMPQGLMEQEEDVLSYALFDKVALKFFEYRKAQKYGIDGAHADAAAGIHTVRPTAREVPFAAPPPDGAAFCPSWA